MIAHLTRIVSPAPAPSSFYTLCPRYPQCGCTTAADRGDEPRSPLTVAEEDDDHRGSGRLRPVTDLLLDWDAERDLSNDELQRLIAWLPGIALEVEYRLARR